jgi:hypothetical protein
MILLLLLLLYLSISIVFCMYCYFISLHTTSAHTCCFIRTRLYRSIAARLRTDVGRQQDQTRFELKVLSRENSKRVVHELKKKRTLYSYLFANYSESYWYIITCICIKLCYFNCKHACISALDMRLSGTQ